MRLERLTTLPFKNYNCTFCKSDIKIYFFSAAWTGGTLFACEECGAMVNLSQSIFISYLNYTDRILDLEHFLKNCSCGGKFNRFWNDYKITGPNHYRFYKCPKCKSVLPKEDLIRLEGEKHKLPNGEIEKYDLQTLETVGHFDQFDILPEWTFNCETEKKLLVINNKIDERFVKFHNKKLFEYKCKTINEVITPSKLFLIPNLKSNVYIGSLNAMIDIDYTRIIKNIELQKKVAEWKIIGSYLEYFYWRGDTIINNNSISSKYNWNDYLKISQKLKEELVNYFEYKTQIFLITGQEFSINQIKDFYKYH